MIGWGVGILIAVTVIMLILRIFFKTAYRVITIIWLVIFLGGLAFGILIYQDAKEFTTGFSENSSLFVLESEGEILAGFYTDHAEEAMLVENVNEVNVKYQANDLDGIMEMDDYFKILIVNESSFEGLEVEIDDFNITSEDAFGVIKAEDPVGAYEELLLEHGHTDAGSEAENSVKIKNFLFGLMFSVANQQDPTFVFTNIRSGNIKVYEETLIFKLLKNFPEFLIKDLIQTG